MGMFKSKEEKQLEKEQKTQETLEYYGLDALTNQKDRDRAKFICDQMNATNLMEIGGALAGNEKTFMNITANYSRVLVEQNMIIIRMLNELLNQKKED